ncbi:MAG: hypothetical protein ACRDHP_03715 [Ktedonobacterales bacterium]
MSASDDYIKTGGNRPSANVPLDEDALRVTPEQAHDAAVALEALEWGDGLTRDQLRRKYRALPQAIYLRLPDSKHYVSAAEVLHEAGLAASRAEGEYLGADPDIPAEESIGDGGPPAWGQQPAVYGASVSVDGGSAEDTEGLLPGDNPELGQEPAS